MHKKKKAAGRRNAPDERNARERILKAAREVFSLWSFKDASTRTVARKAGVEHPLIHYYFGSKENLFKEVAESLHEEASRMEESWLDGMELVSPGEGFPIFMDRMLDYAMANPDVLQISALNMMHIGRIDEIPGYRFIPLNMARMRRILEDKLPLKGTSREIEMFIYCFYSLMISLVGSRSCHAQLLNMDPLGEEYRQWVKDACVTLFLPWFERLLGRA